MAAALVLAGCGVDQDVATRQADRVAAPTTSAPRASSTPPSSAPPTSPGGPGPTPPAPATPAAAPPSSIAPPTTAGTASSKLGDQLDFGDAKTPRNYDDFLTTA